MTSTPTSVGPELDPAREESSPDVSVDVPPGADIHETHELLEVGLQDKFWGLEEGHCGHDTRRDVPERS